MLVLLNNTEHVKKKQKKNRQKKIIFLYLLFHCLHVPCVFATQSDLKITIGSFWYQ